MTLRVSALVLCLSWALCGAAWTKAVPLRTLSAFEENRGQGPAEARFLWRGNSRSGYFTADSAVYVLDSVRIQFDGSGPAAQMRGGDRAPGALNLFLGNTPSQWQRQVARYDSMVTENLYPGIDLEWRWQGQFVQLVYKLTVKPGGQAANVKIRPTDLGVEPFNGPGGIWYAGGRLPGVFIIGTPVGSQTKAGQAVTVGAQLRMESGGTLALDAGAYDPSLPLVLTGTISRFGDLFEGFSNRPAQDDSRGNHYATGEVASPATSAFCVPGSSAGCADTWVAQWSAAGELRWVTILGGSAGDGGSRLALSESGEVFVGGQTYSEDFPVGTSTAQSRFGGPRSSSNGDVFLARLNGDTGELAAATYFGGEEAEFLTDLYAGARGLVTVSGSNSKGFVFRWDSSINRFLFSTTLEEPPTTMAVSAGGAVYLASMLQRKGIAAAGYSFTALKSDGSGIDWTTDVLPPFAGPEVRGLTVSLAAGANGTAWIAGVIGPDFTYGGRTMLARLDVPNKRIISSEYTASSISRSATLQTDGGFVLLTEMAFAPLAVPTPDAILTADCGTSIFLTRLDSSGKVVFASFLGSPASPPGNPGNPFGITTTFLTAAPRVDFSAPTAPLVGCLQNSAARINSALSPGQITTIVGGGFGSLDTLRAVPDRDGRYPRQLGGFRVLLNSEPAPVISVARGQVTIQVPYALPPNQQIQVDLEAEVQVIGSVSSTSLPTNLFLFSADGSGTGQAAALNQDGTVNSKSKPAELGTVVSLFATGGGPLVSQPEDGRILHEAVPLRNAVYPAIRGYTYTIPLAATFAGSAAGLIAGVNQINVRLPDELPADMPKDDVVISLCWPNRTGLLCPEGRVKIVVK